MPHKISKCDQSLNGIERVFAIKAKKAGLVHIGGGGGVRHDKITEVALTFTYNKALTISTARELIVQQVSNLVQLIEETPSYIKCFESTKPLEEFVSMDIIARLPPGTQKGASDISAVSMWHGELHYHRFITDDQFSPSETVYQETFAEAVEIVKGNRVA